MRSPSKSKARHLSILAKSVLVLAVFALVSCQQTPRNRFEYKPDGTPKKKHKYKSNVQCAALPDPGGNGVIAALEVALGTFAFVTPAAASTSMEADLPLFKRNHGILLASESDGGGEMMLPRVPLRCL